MTNLFNLRNLYKVLIIIFLIAMVVKINGQLITLRSYNREIATLKEKKATLEEQKAIDEINSENSREENENKARKDLKMYYPNETPYKGY